MRTQDNMNLDAVARYIWGNTMVDSSCPSGSLVAHYLKRYDNDPASFIRNIIGKRYSGEENAPEVILLVRDCLELEFCTCDVEGTYYGPATCPACEEELHRNHQANIGMLDSEVTS